MTTPQNAVLPKPQRYDIRIGSWFEYYTTEQMQALLERAVAAEQEQKATQAELEETAAHMHTYRKTAARLRAESEALRADAGRYRGLHKLPRRVTVDWRWISFELPMAIDPNEGLDAAIDRAMKGETGEAT